jgi:hypothetical protein
MYCSIEKQQMKGCARLDGNPFCVRPLADKKRLEAGGGQMFIIVCSSQPKKDC